MNPNEAPSDVNTTIDGCTYPGWKMCNFSQAHFFLVNQNTSGNISGTSAAIYKVMEPHSTKWRKANNNWQWVWQSWWSGRLRHQRFAARTPPVYFNVNYQRRKIRKKGQKIIAWFNNCQQSVTPSSSEFIWAQTAWEKDKYKVRRL